MVKYSDIHKAIVKKIKSKFGNITFSPNIEEGITRPSFFIELDNIRASDFMREAMDSEITCRIYYFSKTINDNRMELYNIQDGLNELFQGKLLKIDGELNIEIDTLEFNIVDKVLHCYFGLSFSTDYEVIDDIPLMENLELEG